MPFIGNKPSAVPLTSADIADGIITSAKIVDGTIVNADINASSAIALSKLSTTGTADATTFLRGDGAYTAVSSDFVLLATTDASSSASVSFDGYYSSTYKNYQIIISNMVPATNTVKFYARYRRSNADVTASNYLTLMNWSDSATTGVQTARTYGSYASAQTALETFSHNESINNNSSYGMVMILDIHSPLDTDTYKVTQMRGYTLNSTSGNHVITQNIGILNDATTALSGISFYFSSGNIARGNFKLYGIK